MKRTTIFFASTLAVMIFVFLASSARAQVEIGDFTISGEAGVTGLPRGFSGSRAKFEEYRDIPETVVVPEIQLRIERKQNDFYFDFDTTKPGLDDQYFKVRVGRYGLLDMEFEWDQFPHNFNLDTARTPYGSSNGGGTLTLGSKALGTLGAGLGNPASPVFPPTQGTASTATCATNPFCNWLIGAAGSEDLSLLNKIARFKLRYTPTPGWTFTGGYWANNNTGKRAFGSLFGSSPGSYNITELPEPIDYQTHNIELGSEYAGQGWSLGLKYNASLFHNSVSTLVWDNPVNLSGVGSACIDSKNYTVTSATGALSSPGSCRGRLDLYPSNQAHTFTLTGTARLPVRTHFFGTVSYGWRLQDDDFLPTTINQHADFAVRGLNSKSGCGPGGCGGPTRSSLDGDIRPLMVNLTLVNNFFKGLDLKAYYRLYNLDNRSKVVTLTDGIPINDASTTANPNCGLVAGACADAGHQNNILQYSKNTVGADAGYSFTQWLSAKLGVTWERMHREGRQLSNSNEVGFGPTVDVKPSSSLLLRASYKHFWRSADGYEFDADTANISRMVDQAARDRDRVSLFAQLTPWEMLSFHAGFEFTNDRFNKSVLGLQNDSNYSPSVGLIFAPVDWLKLFADYNWDSFSWLLDGMQRSSSTQNPNDPATCDANCQLRRWNSKGKEQVHTFSIGTDVDLIKNLLAMRINYGFSYGRSNVLGSGSTCLGGTPPTLPFPGSGACTPATDYAPITNLWHELLMRLEYQVHKNIALNFGYYFNHFNTKDKGVDIMQSWMGNYDQWSVSGNANLGRSMFLGDQLKGPFTAHAGLVGFKIKF